MDTLVMLPLLSEALAEMLTLAPSEKLLPLPGLVKATSGCGFALTPPQTMLEQVPVQQSELKKQPNEFAAQEFNSKAPLEGGLVLVTL